MNVGSHLYSFRGVSCTNVAEHVCPIACRTPRSISRNSKLHPHQVEKLPNAVGRRLNAIQKFRALELEKALSFHGIEANPHVASFFHPILVDYGHAIHAE